MESNFRVGFGYDVHKLVVGRDLILCGEKIPYTLGLEGHSDADVAVHALMDALLGALAMGDIGCLFPDTDQQYRNADSMMLLRRVYASILERGWQLGNCDITIVAQKPKLASYIEMMRDNLSKLLNVSKNEISVKATTTEHLGFEGRQEGISAQASVLLLRA